ncbi:MAG: metal ABC transporter ATP-binding protein [Saprospiraceae bacterium]|nr:metal ABC transporter ATP-binding protein [Saprospiraceae bacterium]MBK7737948.1 metal ABC transporter ATP-binding protein [Saprospiraceae bacterium]MBK7913473.1 metal ABC transporter ATP-binding protein [Saprospiraceae bacterium]
MYSIEINGLSVAYEHKRVLSNIYLKIEPGFIYGLIGPNGAGKSTLFKSILKEVEPNAGEIKILGSVAKDMLIKIAYVPQRDEVDWQFPATVYDIVSMGRFPHKSLLDRLNTTDRTIILEALDQLDIIKLKDRQIGELSGGQQQRVFLARALCQQSEILLMDEPFVGVDIKTENKIIDILKELVSKGKTVLVVHHDLDSVMMYFDRVILINQKLMAYGDTKTVFTKENISATYSSQSNLLQFLKTD